MKVSVLLICYKQEAYVAQAIQSILSQKTDFEWELLIGEDASPDETAKVITECIADAPRNCTVRPFLRNENMGASRNLFDLIQKAEGEYLTVLEGDDYWLRTDRLQTLADFLDANKQYVGVSHKRERRRDGVLVKYDPEENLTGKRFALEDYYNGKRFSAMACMFRNIYAGDYDKFAYLYTGARNACDQVMCYSILFAGDIFILNETFGVYRIDAGGYCSHQKTISVAKDYLIQNRRLQAHYGAKPAIQREISQLHASIIKASLREEGVKGLLRYYRSVEKSERSGVLNAFAKAVCGKLLKRRR